MKFFVIFVCLLLSPVQAAWGDPTGAGPETESPAGLDLALQYRNEGDLYRAVTEAKRFLFFFPHHPRAGEARAILAEARERWGETADAPGGRSIDPWDKSRPAAETGETRPPAADRSATADLIRFYQQFLRSYRSPESSCPSYPNCSEYALQAVRKHGSLLGIFIYVDRFWREASTVGTPPFVYYRGRRLHYDPLELNDYWLTEKEAAP